MGYGMRYTPDEPYARGGLGATIGPRGVPAPGMPVTTVTGRAGMAPALPGSHVAPALTTVATYQRNGIAFAPGTIGLPPPMTGMPAPGFPPGTLMPPPDIITDPATGKIKWWVWGIVAVILLYVVKKYII